MKRIVTNMILLIWFMLVLSCSNQQRATDETESAKKMDSLRYADSVLLQSRIQDSIFASSSAFKIQVERITPMLSRWGFKKLGDSSYRNRDAFNRHWCLKSFNQNSTKDITSTPKAKNWQSIKVINQVAYQSNEIWIMEEWQLMDKPAARHWLNFLHSSKQLDEQYPHRVCWVEGNALYIIKTESTREWTERADSLVEEFTGRKRALIQLFAKPIDVAEYKKKKMGSNSGGAGGHNFYFKPDTTGFYYSYFWFIQLRSQYPAEILFRGLILTTYIQGKPKSYYPDSVPEELIGIKSKVADPDLGQLDLVGKNKRDIEKEFGLRVSAEENYIIEEFDGDVLIIHFHEEKVDWYNYMRTTLNLKTDALPEVLKYYEEWIPKPN